jgi:hypothetical protein
MLIQKARERWEFAFVALKRATLISRLAPYLRYERRLGGYARRLLYFKEKRPDTIGEFKNLLGWAVWNCQLIENLL